MEEDIEFIEDGVSELEQLRKLHDQNASVPEKIQKDEEQNTKQDNQPRPIKKVKKKTSKRVIGIRLILLSILLIPLFGYLYIISLNSDRLINSSLSIIMIALTVVSIIILISGICLVLVNKKSKNDKRLKLVPKILLGTFFTGYVTISTIVMILLYGPNNTFREWLVTTAMMTMNHRYLAEWFYDDATIKEIQDKHTVIEVGEDTNPDLVQIGGGNDSQTVYANEYEEAILKKDEGNDLYKIIDIDIKKNCNSVGLNCKKIKGKLAVVYDPSKVKLATSKGIGLDLDTAYGQYITTMAEDHDAVISINAGGFYDPDWNSRGGVPHGIVISNGKLITNFKRALSTGGLIGFNKENKLVLAKMSAKEALAQGIRDAVDFGPFLIVNGKSSFVSGNGGWGDSPRTAIAQRKDGIVLFLVIDGRQTASDGADMSDLVEILLNYGAYNAANLDGGTSSAMTLNGEIITNPRNGNFKAKTRAVPNAWIVVE